MRIIKNRTHLRWLVPLFIVLLVHGCLLWNYKTDIHERAITAKETEMSHAIEDELGDIDVSIASASSCIMASSNAISQYALAYNRNQILVILKNIVSSTDVSMALISDQEGNGYDAMGKDVSISEESYFAELSSEYSRGGMGMILPDEYAQDEDHEVCLVCHVDFENDEQGFLVCKMPVVALSDSLFMDKYMVDRVAVITLDGTILASTRNGTAPGKNGEEAGNSFWKLLPNEISKDTIMLNLSQKTHYMGKVNGYGYILVLPMKSATGGAVVLIRDDQMLVMTSIEERSFRDLVRKICILGIAFLVLVTLANIISDKIEEIRRKKRLARKETDPVTGLLTKKSAEEEILSYIKSVENPQGLMFLIGIEGVTASSELDNTILDARRKQFAKNLGSNFRASDILARVDKDRYLVFLKGVHDDKDVRKQTDEMQMFLHDILVDTTDSAYAHAGAALFPDHGRDVAELMKFSEAALERSKEAGTGKLSF